jgi:hypothetical protein
MNWYRLDFRRPSVQLWPSCREQYSSEAGYASEAKTKVDRSASMIFPVWVFVPALATRYTRVPINRLSWLDETKTEPLLGRHELRALPRQIKRARPDPAGDIVIVSQ